MDTESRERPARAPALFISDGVADEAPDNGDDEHVAALGQLGRKLGRPPAVVVVSSGWSADPMPVTACRGDCDLSARIARMIGAVSDTVRGPERDVSVRLGHLFAPSSVPVVQVSPPAGARADAFVVLGRELAPLRGEGIVLVGLGTVVMNRRRFQADGSDPPAWARSFDDWVAARFCSLDLSSLLHFRREAPFAHLAAPIDDFLLPLFFALGAALPGDRAEEVFSGFRHGTMSLRCLALGD